MDFLDNPEKWPKGHRKRSQYYDEYNKPDSSIKVPQTLLYEYDFMQKNNLFGLDMLFRKMPKKSFVKGKKQEIEGILMYCYHKDPQKVLRLPGISITTEEEALALVEDYWIFLEYNNVKRDGNNVEGALETPVNVELSKKGIKEFVTRKMTGDETFQDVREVLAEVENSKNIYDGLNMIIATSMISHGVDADRFNNMFFYGIPGNMAEYIQAYSRTGRRYPSIVVDIIRPTRETDMSFLRNFVSMHKYKDMLIEAVPINRWASKAITNTLPGIFASLLLQKYDKDLQYTVGTLFQMKNIKKAIELNALDKNTIINEMIVAYGCEDVSHNADDLGNRYKEKIREFINYIFGEIQDKVWENQSIFQGFSIMNCRIMNSLRDTDSQLFIEME